MELQQWRARRSRKFVGGDSEEDPGAGREESLEMTMEALVDGLKAFLLGLQHPGDFGGGCCASWGAAVAEEVVVRAREDKGGAWIRRTQRR